MNTSVAAVAADMGIVTESTTSTDVRIAITNVIVDGNGRTKKAQEKGTPKDQANAQAPNTSSQKVMTLAKAPKLTEEKRLRCPHCGSTDLEAHSALPHSYTCNACGKHHNHLHRY